MARAVEFGQRRLRLKPRIRSVGPSRLLLWPWLAGILLIAVGYGWSPLAPSDDVVASFSTCSGAVRTSCVVDGNSFWLKGAKYRVADIDTPDVRDPKCSRERELGEQAKHRLLVLLNDGPFALSRALRDEDKYGRKVRTVYRDGKSLGETLIEEGLAHRWIGHKQTWCG